MEQGKRYTIVGTDVEEVRKRNAASGLSYREVKELLARTGGKRTAMYSDTDAATVRAQLE